MQIKTRCTECGGTALTWDFSARNKSDVVEGRLRLHDVTFDFFLGCDTCSETLQVVSAQKIADHLNQQMASALPPPLTPTHMAEISTAQRLVEKRAKWTSSDCMDAAAELARFMQENEALRAQAVPAVLAPAQFPARVLELLQDMADRKGSGNRGPWQDGQGIPLQDDADAALRWIGNRSA